MNLTPSSSTPAAAEDLESRFRHLLRQLTRWPLAALAAVTLVLLGLVTYLFHSVRWVDHTEVVLLQLLRVEKLAVEMETELRGYRITGDAVFRDAHDRATALFPIQVEALEVLVRDNASQTEGIRRLRASHRAWSEYAAAVRARAEAGAPVDAPLQLRGRVLLDAMRVDLETMERREEALLDQRSRVLRRVRIATIAGVLFVGLILAPLLVTGLRRLMLRLDRTYRGALSEVAGERERLHVTLASIGDAVIATDTAGTITYLNPIAEALTGWPAEAARGQSLETVFHIVNEHSRQTVENPVQRALREGAIVGLANHTLLLAKDGRETPIADSAAPIRDRTGAIAGVVMVFRDQTEEREAEGRLRESEARKAAVLASSLDAIVSMDARGLIVEFNAAAEALFGHSAAAVLGRPLADVIVPERMRAAHNRGLAHYLATGEGPVLSKRIELPALRADGTEFSAELSINRVPGVEPPVFSGFIRDITERQRAEAESRAAREAAEAASRAKDNFLAALSHELRTPLTPVLMTAEALHGDTKLPADVRDQLGMIARNIALEARLIDDLLDLTRISRGKLAMRPEPCDAHSLIALAVDIVRDEAREKQIDIALDLTAECNHLHGDPARLQQVFWNLLRNAVKFTPAGGRIQVRSHDGACSMEGGDDARICLEFRDNGIGLTPDALDRIFQPFEQAGLMSDQRSSGLGLGLAIARAIVDLHHGAIHAQSAGLGQGATFIVELPGAKIAPLGWETQPAAEGSGPALPEAPMRLLVVEDHEPTLQVITRLLTRAGHRITPAGTIQAALAAAGQERFDAVVSDLGLPDGTGIQLMEKLRAEHGLRGIALSGYGMDEDLRRSRAAGFAAHLVKPVDINELRRALRQLAANPC